MDDQRRAPERGDKPNLRMAFPPESRGGAIQGSEAGDFDVAGAGVLRLPRVLLITDKKVAAKYRFASKTLQH